jgi:hypothetical protein
MSGAGFVGHRPRGGQEKFRHFLSVVGRIGEIFNFLLFSSLLICGKPLAV